MIYACTFCDKKYAVRALMMYYSLLDTCRDDVTLYWLCLDDETFERVVKVGFPGIVAVRLSDIEEEYDLASLKKLPNSEYGDAHSNFCWRLTPIFIHHLLKFYVPVNGKLLYADSDIFFYHSPQLIFDTMGHKPVGIHTHRFSRPYDDNTATGWYNVGVMVFTNNEVGYKVCNQWRTWMMDVGTELYKKYGTCGDQKWLNLFIPTFGLSNICVFDEEGDCGHMAPWNVSGVGHPQKHYITFKGRKQPVVFFHFSHFRIDENGKWHDSWHGEWKPSSDRDIFPYYQDYFEKIQSLIMSTV